MIAVGSVCLSVARITFLPECLLWPVSLHSGSRSTADPFFATFTVDSLPGRRGRGEGEWGTNLAVASIRRENWEIKIPLLLARAAAAAALFDKILPSL